MRLRLADREIDLDAHEIRAEGAPVHVEPQVFDLIALLARNPGRLLTREEIVAAVWAGRIVSDSTIDARIAAARRALGDDGRRQAVIATVPRRGLRLVAPVETLHDAPPPAAPPPAVPPRAAPRHTVRFARSADGTRIAWARTGEGPPLIRTSHFLGHVEADWRCPAFAAAYARLSGSCTLIRYDQRGGGLSDRDPPSLDLERHADDLEAVADAAGLERFALYGGSQGAPISIAFALRRPERVSRLVLYGGFARGRLMRGDPEAEAQAETVLGMIRAGWGAPEGPFLQAFASLYMPDATPEQLAGMVDLQRASASPDGAARIRRAVDRFDVSARLAELRVPTLVIHCTRDGVHPFAEGRRIAEHVSEAEFLPIESRNHVLLPQDPNWAALDAILAFALAGEGERA